MGIRASRSFLGDSARSLRLVAGLGAALLFAASCDSLIHRHHDAHPGLMSSGEESVQIYFKDQPLPCGENYVDLGHIQAASGEELEPDEEQEEYATFQAALAWLKKEAYARGASGVIIIDRKVNKEKTHYFVTGQAIRCNVTGPGGTATSSTPEQK